MYNYYREWVGTAGREMSEIPTEFVETVTNPSNPFCYFIHSLWSSSWVYEATIMFWERKLKLEFILQILSLVEVSVTRGISWTTRVSILMFIGKVIANSQVSAYTLVITVSVSHRGLLWLDGVAHKAIFPIPWRVLNGTRMSTSNFFKKVYWGNIVFFIYTWTYLCGKLMHT